MLNEKSESKYLASLNYQRKFPSKNSFRRVEDHAGRGVREAKGAGAVVGGRYKNIPA